ncbi:hypothetical protein X777_16895 [Ooceraea biroi]|uniref:Uncharacterized protein n=1 Tax=Ooceraea biroi TaxID=2015173 RepID=A0A026WTE4_OOCBI|nr:hypothetical protein X777_16895 [Ooceraea biroi]
MRQCGWHAATRAHLPFEHGGVQIVRKNAFRFLAAPDIESSKAAYSGRQTCSDFPTPTVAASMVK